MRLLRLACAIGACVWLASCATAPEVQMTPEELYAPETVEVPSPFVEYPPIEPVEPPIVASTAPPPQPAILRVRDVTPRVVDGDAEELRAMVPPLIVQLVIERELIAAHGTPVRGIEHEHDRRAVK